MLIKPIIERLKRVSFFIIVVFLISMFFNLRTHDGFSIARMGLVHYWILTIALAVALLLFAFWIAYTAYCFRKIALDKLVSVDATGVEMKLKIVALKDRCYFYLMAILPCLIIYIFVIFVMSYFRPAGMTMFYAYLYNYMPYIAAILFVFSYLMLKAIDSCPFRLFNYAKPLTIEVVKKVEVIKEVEIVKEKLVVPAHVLDEHIDFYELFPVLYCIAGIGPIRDAQGWFPLV
ncbi:hypothetical protein ACFX5U_09670 [Sphingobacterium sp. SG20118]|uniref:hypothetical protein n=1 Tax=Sphingobacterium sp. SG20118 TaxID=3367156 RepID=UPI0037DFC617